MRTLPIVIATALCLASSISPAADRFASDKPSPLKLVPHGDSDEAVDRFAGKVRLSGRFVIAWGLVNQISRHLRATFVPDDNSAKLLPHAMGGERVAELLLSNREEAAKLLLEPDVATKVLSKKVLSAGGEATVLIGDYRAVVACDQRVYLARLLAVTSRRSVALAAGHGRRFDC
jgi:hypothetical protein